MTIYSRGIMSYLMMAIVITEILSSISAKECNRFNGTCCYNEYFDNTTGKCLICRHGHFGKGCNLSCERGYYGYLCSKSCECEVHLCDTETGCRTRQTEKTFPEDEVFFIFDVNTFLMFGLRVCEPGVEG
ncbi:uncharacterized protein [Magallana gigas]|uniref:uncharacterized protein n=1 Tax=Magallana gigas TaxID=29159 RepID=UPI0033419B2A